MPSRSLPLVIGHRGASGYRPEHTRPAYELALALGVDAIEPDIVASRDGVLVLRHENEISGTTDIASRPEFADRRTTKRIDGHDVEGWFTEDLTWAELATLRARERLPAIRSASATFDGQYPILRLVDLLAMLDRAAEERAAAGEPVPGLVAEIKHASYSASVGLPLDELFTAELAAAGWSARDERLTIESFEKSVLDRFAERGVGDRRVYLLESEGAPPDLVALLGSDAPDYAESLTPAGLAALADSVDGISVDKKLLLRRAGPALVADAHAVGLLVYCWTLRPENRFLAKAHRQGRDPAAFGDWRAEFDQLLGTGVDGVFADHPDLVREARAARR